MDTNYLRRRFEEPPDYRHHSSAVAGTRLERKEPCLPLPDRSPVAKRKKYAVTRPYPLCFSGVALLLRPRLIITVYAYLQNGQSTPQGTAAR